MIYPFIVIAYFFIIQFFMDNYKLKRNIYSSIFLSFVVLISFVILELLRLYCQSMFGDIANYKELFEEIESVSYVFGKGYGIEYYYSKIEIGFSLLISVFKIFSNSYDLFLFLISIIELLTFYFFCRKFEISFVNVLPIYVAMFFITFEIGMLRQALGFCCFLVALVYIRKKSIYLLFICLGAMFHISTVFCILFIWVDKFVNRKLYYSIIFFSICIYILQLDIVSLFVGYIETISIGNLGRVSFYLDVDRPNNYLGIGFWERIILLIVLSLMYVDLRRRNKINRYNNILFNLGMSLIIFQMIFFMSPTITSRLRYFIIIFPGIFIAQYLYIEYGNRFIKGLGPLYKLAFSGYLLMHLFFLSSYLK